MNADITKELIFDNFADKTTPLQRKQINDWLLNPANEELYYRWLEEWENKNPEYQPPSGVLLAKYTKFLYSNPDANEKENVLGRPVPFMKRRGWLRWAVAASVALILGLSGWLLRDIVYYKTYQTAYGEIKTFILVDGSQVTLNANSSLRLLRWGFAEEDREVFLDGEANFAVVHPRNDRRFVVKTEKNFEVVVLGTEFTVFSRHRGARVVLNKGKVRLNYRQGNITRQLTMKPGELVSFNRQNEVSLRSVPLPQNFSIWKEKRFVFDETVLADVAQMLEETYGLEVTIDTPELAQRKLMGSFRADNVDELLHTISELLDISVVREEDRVLLSEK